MTEVFAKRLVQEQHELTRLATEKKRGLIAPLEILVFIAVFFVTQIAAAIPGIFPGIFIGIILAVIYGPDGIGQVEAIISDPVFSTGTALFFTSLPLLLTILFCMLIQKRSVMSMGFRGKDFAVQYLKGLLVGFVLFTLVIAIGTLTGGFRFTGVSDQFHVLFLLLFFAGFMIQGMEEEVICRGYFMVSLSRRSPMWLAVLINAVLFALMHLFNPGIGVLPIVNLMLFGAFASLYMLRTGNIWGVGAVHTMWNYVQGNIYGLPVSGITEMPTLVRFEQTGSTLINGGEFGPEGGLVVTAVYLAGILLVLFLPERKR